ncbi:heme biosynthesis HemY N-terminal domain-containing protein [Octadecabacter sp. 1_MG-2023]|uniref:heme biosynthesis protein HemY n=1 Tax=unclassified Octadecabacter TaxID=196158 RepID=UPI001C0A0B91|nr:MULTISPECIES: heme biosynthesis HemY N-terminal domain-containing protein [unclassified Octadecabacter]MBU2992350.1 heme biosynthesis protein HemY [Octadecabacter sp. B2R22]MDO6734893.1 heme biosynthesis HemY N-terminal domain-containing protein [Octadecabacter sp. 1_MG-2023]
MLWSLIKILAFVAVVMAATFGATMLMDMDGSATIDIGGQAATFSVIEMVVGLIVLVALIWLMFKLIGLAVATFKFLNGDETAISRYFSRNRERKGYEALSEGMMALASGEGRLAMAKANRAEKFLERPELTNLLTAQAAELAGDRKTAEQTYRKLLEDDKTRFVGVRGIMKQKLEDGDTDTALVLAEKAFAIKPKHVETQDTLLRLQAEKCDWKGARETLTAKLKTGQLPRNVHKRRDAVLALSEAKGIFEEGQTVEAQEASIEANRMSPDLIPAAVMAAQAYIEKGNARAASRVLKKAWDVAPHPDLAATFAAIAPDETPAARLKRFRTLTKVHPTHAETKMLLAELYIAAEDFPEARRAISELVVEQPTARNLTIMAAIERGEGSDDAVVRGWLAKALTATRGPQWICENCQHIHPVWAPVCGNCSGFDTLTWREPPKGEVAMPAGVEMLPLIVGQIEAPVEVAEVVDAEIVDEDVASEGDSEATK